MLNLFGCMLIVWVFNDYTGVQILRSRFPSNGGTDWFSTAFGAVVDGIVVWAVLSFVFNVI